MSAQDKVNGPSASGTEIAWSVEARSSLEDHPIVYGDRVLTMKWAAVHFERGTFGVPAGNPLFDTYLTFGYLSYPAAQALRWWFVAGMEENHRATGLQTRLVRHIVKYQRSAQRVAEYDTISQFDENREAANCKPEAASTHPGDADQGQKP